MLLEDAQIIRGLAECPWQKSVCCRSPNDLSKAFDCLPHDILLDKLSVYGMSTDSVSLLESYLLNRKQQIKINSILSSWADIQKGVPQGSLYFLMFLVMIFFILWKRVLYIVMRMTILCLMVILIWMYLPQFWNQSQMYLLIGLK